MTDARAFLRAASLTLQVTLVALLGACASSKWVEKSADGGTIRVSGDSTRAREDALDEIRKFCGGSFTLERDSSNRHYANESNAIAASKARDLSSPPPERRDPTPQRSDANSSGGLETTRLLVFRCDAK